MSTSVKLAARVLLMREDGQMLVVNRPHDPHLFCMPGGKTEPGETLVETGCREMAEETGVRLPSEALQPLYQGTVYNDQATDQAPYEVTTYVASWLPEFGEPTSQEPGIEPQWMTPEAFAQACAAPGYDHAVLAAWRAAQRQPVLQGDQPRIVWRGETGGDMFDTFDLNQTHAGVGFFFAEDQAHAQSYAGRGSAPRAFTLRANRVLDLTDCYKPDPVMHAFLQYYAAQFDDWADRVSGEPMDVYGFLEAGALYDYEGTGSGRRWNALFSMAWEAGFDAVRVPDSTDGSFLSTVWVVKDPEQIAFHVPSPQPAAPETGRRSPRF